MTAEEREARRVLFALLGLSDTALDMYGGLGGDWRNYYEIYERSGITYDGYAEVTLNALDNLVRANLAVENENIIGANYRQWKRAWPPTR